MEVVGAAATVDDQTATAAARRVKVVAGRMGTAVVRTARVAARTAVVPAAERVVVAEVGRNFAAGIEIEIAAKLGIAALQETG